MGGSSHGRSVMDCVLGQRYATRACEPVQTIRISKPQPRCGQMFFQKAATLRKNTDQRFPIPRRGSPCPAWSPRQVHPPMKGGVESPGNSPSTYCSSSSSDLEEALGQGNAVSHESTPLVHNERENTDGDEEYVLTDPTVAHANAGAIGATLNLVNNIIGGGVLALPFAMLKCGVIAGTALLGLVALASAYSCVLLVRASRGVDGPKSYSSLARASFGTAGKVLVDVAMIVFLFGVLVGYLIIISDVVTPLFSFLEDIGLGVVYHRQLITLAVAYGVIFPLCLLRSVDALRFTSGAALICILYLLGVVVFRSLETLIKEGLKDSVNVGGVKTIQGVLVSIPIMSFAFTFHPNIFPVFTEMRNPTKTRIHRVMYSSVAICAVVYLFVGVFGYLDYLEDTEGNIFNNYKNDIAADVGKGALALVVCFSYPLLHYPCRQAIDFLFFGVRQPGDPFTRWHWARHICIAVMLVSLSYLLSILIPSITIVFSFVGATAGSVIVFVMPALMNLILDPIGKWYGPRKLPAVFLAIIGVVLGTLSVAAIVLDEFTDVW